jgi:hypothetical protein
LPLKARLATATIDDADLPEPRRTFDKREALRHLIHAAIRLVTKMEDPFAVHLLVHSADKILIDLAKQNSQELRIGWELHIKDEYHGEFFKRYRETYNYFKHAHRDFETDLPVRDIAMTNVTNLFITVVNYQHMFGECTHHILLFLIFMVVLMPKIIVPNDVIGIELLKGARDMQGMTPAEFFKTLEEHAEALPNFYPEASKDIDDIKHFYHLTFQELREGTRESPRLFKLASYD